MLDDDILIALSAFLAVVSLVQFISRRDLPVAGQRTGWIIAAAVVLRRAADGRANAGRRRLIDIERPQLKPLPARRTSDHDETIVTATRSATAAAQPSPAGRPPKPTRKLHTQHHPDCRCARHQKLLPTSISSDNKLIKRTSQGHPDRRSPPSRSPRYKQRPASIGIAVRHHRNAQFNMLALAVFGTRLERRLGPVRFALLYFGAGLASVATITLLTGWGIEAPDLLVGASGAIMGLIGGLAALLLRQPGPDRRRARAGLRQMVLLIVLQSGIDLMVPQISMTGHLSGAVAGFLIALALPLPRGSPRLRALLATGYA